MQPSEVQCVRISLGIYELLILPFLYHIFKCCNETDIVVTCCMSDVRTPDSLCKHLKKDSTLAVVSEGILIEYLKKHLIKRVI